MGRGGKRPGDGRIAFTQPRPGVWHRPERGIALRRVDLRAVRTAFRLGFREEDTLANDELHQGVRSVVNAILTYAGGVEQRSSFDREHWHEQFSNLSEAAEELKAALDKLSPEMAQFLEGLYTRRGGNPYRGSGEANRSEFWRENFQPNNFKFRLSLLGAMARNAAKAVTPRGRPPRDAIERELFERLAFAWFETTREAPTYTRDQDNAPRGTAFERFCDCCMELLNHAIRPKKIDTLIVYAVKRHDEFMNTKL